MKSLQSILFNQKRLSAILGLGLLLFISSCAKNPVTGKRQFNLMGEGQEIALGQQSDPGIVAGYGKYNDDKLQNFINQKGKQMAAISHRNHLNYEFKILDSPVVNAFAVPGGYVYFTRGIMAHFNNEAEFAGVLGHEIGHVSARHSAQQYSNQMLGQVLLIGGLIASPEFAQFADVASQSMSMLFLKFGRDMESQSDELGVEYSTKIGYDAHQMGDFFNTLHRLSTDDGKKEPLPTFMSTHPDPKDRYFKVHQMADAAQTAGKDYKVGRDSYLRMIDGIIYGNDPRQGFVENNIFYHPEMKFSYKVPSGWQVNNTPAQVQMLQKDGEAAMFLTIGQGKSLQEAINAEVQKNKLEVIEKQSRNVNGNPAMVVRSKQTGQNQQGQQINLQLISYYIQYNGAIYVFHGMTYDRFFSKYKTNFDNCMRSFKKLTDASKLNKKPERIKIKTVPANMSLQKALVQFNMPSDRLTEISILNGMKLSDPVKKGMLIKTIGE